MSTTDRVLECIADSIRRETVAVLRDRTTAVSVTELAAVVARREGSPVADVPATDRRPVAVELAHAHLPALADADLVDRTPGEDAVAAIDHPALARRVAAREADEARRIADTRRERDRRAPADVVR